MSLSISTRRHLGSDDETAATSEIYDADFPPRESVREIHSHGRTFGRSFQSAGIYQSSKLLFPPFSVIVASPHLVHRRPFAVSRPPSIRPLFPSPKRVPRLFPPKICAIQIKRRRLRSAYQCCFYRIGARQTSARFTLLPPPFFRTIVFYPWDRHRPYPCCRRRN